MNQNEFIKLADSLILSLTDLKEDLKKPIHEKPDKLIDLIILQCDQIQDALTNAYDVHSHSWKQ